jgi:hypothetical protein
MINLERDAWSTDQLLTYYYKKREREIGTIPSCMHAWLALRLAWQMERAELARVNKLDSNNEQITRPPAP